MLKINFVKGAVFSVAAAVVVVVGAFVVVVAAAAVSVVETFEHSKRPLFLRKQQKTVFRHGLKRIETFCCKLWRQVLT